MHGHRVIPVWMFAASLTFIPGVALCAEAPGAADLFVNWDTLRLEVRGAGFFSGAIELTHGRNQDKAYIETQATARFLGARIGHSHTLSILEPMSGRTVKHLRYTKRRGRRFVFDESGYRVDKLKPPAGSAVPVQRWDVASTRRFEHPPAVEGQAPEPLLDFYGMLLHLRHAGIRNKGDKVTLNIATSKGTTPYRIQVVETRDNERRIKHLETGKKHSIALREIRLRITPADPEKADKGFLNMEGESELWVEADSMALLEVSGRVRRAGNVNLRLVGIQ